MGAGADITRAPKWLPGMFAVNAILVALVLSNDLHGLMFIMDLSQPGWSARENYGYSVVYYIIFAVLFFEVVGSVIILFIKAKYSPRRAGVVFIIVFMVLLTMYTVGYTTRIPFFVDSDLTMVVSVLTLFFLELLMRVGQIPININYRRLFRHAGNMLQIVDESGRSIIFSNGAEPLEHEVWRKLKHSDVPIRTDENTFLQKSKITGGYAVWQEDVTSINKLKADIEASNLELAAANNLLSGDAQAMEQAARAKVRTELYAAFERDIASHERRLADILSEDGTYPDDGGGSGGLDSGSRLKHAALITCYIKRRSYLLSMTLDGINKVSYNEYVVFMDEMAELARLAGVECFTYCSLSGEINLSYATLFYDFWDSILGWAVANDSDGVVLQTVYEGGRIAMKLLMSDAAMLYDLPGYIAKKVSAEGGLFEKTEMENRAVLALSFPEDISGSFLDFPADDTADTNLRGGLML